MNGLLNQRLVLWFQAACQLIGQSREEMHAESPPPPSLQVRIHTGKWGIGFVPSLSHRGHRWGASCRRRPQAGAWAGRHTRDPVRVRCGDAHPRRSRLDPPLRSHGPDACGTHDGCCPSPTVQAPHRQRATIPTPGGAHEWSHCCRRSGLWMSPPTGVLTGNDGRSNSGEHSGRAGQHGVPVCRWGAPRRRTPRPGSARERRPMDVPWRGVRGAAVGGAGHCCAAREAGFPGRWVGGDASVSRVRDRSLPGAMTARTLLLGVACRRLREASELNCGSGLKPGCRSGGQFQHAARSSGSEGDPPRLHVAAHGQHPVLHVQKHRVEGAIKTPSMDAAARIQPERLAGRQGRAHEQAKISGPHVAWAVDPTNRHGGRSVPEFRRSRHEALLEATPRDLLLPSRTHPSVVPGDADATGAV